MQVSPVFPSDSNSLFKAVHPSASSYVDDEIAVVVQSFAARYL